jgi:hypothetical protein
VKGADFVLAHHTAITLDISTQNGGEFAFDAVFGHSGTLFEVLNRVAQDKDE